MNSLLLPFSWEFLDSDQHEKSEKSFPQELFSKEKKSREAIVKWNKKAVDSNTFFISSLLYLHSYFIVYAALVTVNLLRHGILYF